MGRVPEGVESRRSVFVNATADKAPEPASDSFMMCIGVKHASRVREGRSPCAQARSGNNGGADGTRTRNVLDKKAALARLFSGVLLVVLLSTALRPFDARLLSRDKSRESSQFRMLLDTSFFDLKVENGGADGTRTRDLSRDRRAF